LLLSYAIEVIKLGQNAKTILRQVGHWNISLSGYAVKITPPDCDPVIQFFLYRVPCTQTNVRSWRTCVRRTYAASTLLAVMSAGPPVDPGEEDRVEHHLD